jgi:hypothetical protein
MNTEQHIEELEHKIKKWNKQYSKVVEEELVPLLKFTPFPSLNDKLRTEDIQPIKSIDELQASLRELDKKLALIKNKMEVSANLIKKMKSNFREKRRKTKYGFKLQ